MDDFEENKRKAQQNRDQNHKRFLSRSRENLEKCIKRCLTTTMIGALSAFEKAYPDIVSKYDIDNNPDGYINEELDDIASCQEEWDRVRKEILDLGHLNIDICLSHLNEYSVEHVGTNIYYFYKGK